MCGFIKEKYNVLRNNLNYECIKICLIYQIMGFVWIYFSDSIINKMVKDKNVLSMIGTYKGLLYVFITSVILYWLICKLNNKIYKTKKRLKNSYDELEAYHQQLSAAEEELTNQYDQILHNEKLLIKSEEKSKAIIKAIPDLLFVIASNGVVLDYQASENQQLMIPKNNFIGKPISEIMPKEISEIAYEKLKLVFELNEVQSFDYEVEILNKKRYYEIRMVKKDEKKALAICREITKRKELENHLHYLSYHDQLTGLYNRRFFEEELNRLDIEENLPLTIAFGDVNGLKLINDSFGHSVGDELIEKAGQLIKKGCRTNDIVARLGGDEFIFLLLKTDEEEAEKIIRNMNRIMLNEKIGNINISISFGHATKKYKEESAKEILKNAEDYMYKKKIFDSQSARGKTIDAIINALHEKNKREQQHSIRVSELCESMGKALNLKEREIQELKTAGLFHDIGKIAIEENILNKPSKLTEAEWKEIKRHSEIGYRILNTVNDMSEIAQYVLLHHERWNGTGYPNGLKGENIPIQSRIIAIADTYDAMTSNRSYRDSLPEIVAIEELQKNAGIQFDSNLVEVFVQKVLKF